MQKTNLQKILFFLPKLFTFLPRKWNLGVYFIYNISLSKNTNKKCLENKYITIKTFKSYSFCKLWMKITFTELRSFLLLLFITPHDYPIFIHKVIFLVECMGLYHRPYKLHLILKGFCLSQIAHYFLRGRFFSTSVLILN